MSAPEQAAASKPSTPVDEDPAFRSALDSTTRVVATTALALAIGGLTSWAQGGRLGAFAPVANSVSGWTIPTVLLIALTRLRPGWSALAGTGGFLGMVIGYTVASALRGLYYNPMLFGVVAVVAGPFIGVATAWLRSSDWRPHLGSGLLAGILVGESVYGLTAIRATTGWVYWGAVGLLGLALHASTVLRRPARRVSVAAGLVLLLTVTAVFNVAYRLLGAVTA